MGIYLIIAGSDTSTALSEAALAAAAGTGVKPRFDLFCSTPPCQVSVVPSLTLDLAKIQAVFPKSTVLREIALLYVFDCPSPREAATFLTQLEASFLDDKLVLTVEA